VSDPFEAMSPKRSEAMMRARQREIPTDLPREEYQRQFYAEVDAHLSRIGKPVSEEVGRSEEQDRVAQAEVAQRLERLKDAFVDILRGK